MHVDQQNRDPGVAKDANIEDIENLMLFEVDSDLKEIDVPIKETSSERRFQMRDLSKITPIKESQYKASKFWQTPSKVKSSLFTSIEQSYKEKDYKCEGSLIEMVQEFLNKEGNTEADLYDLSSRDENLEQLTDELVHVFFFKNIDNNIETQKEDLI